MSVHGAAVVKDGHTHCFVSADGEHWLEIEGALKQCADLEPADVGPAIRVGKQHGRMVWTARGLRQFAGDAELELYPPDYWDD